MKIRADLIYCGDGRVLQPGFVQVTEATITEVREASVGDQADVELRGCVLFPGLINAHVHMDYTRLRRAISPTTSFVKWLGEINQWKHHLEPEEVADGIREGLCVAARTGTVALLNITAYPRLYCEPALSPRAITAVEGTDLNRPFLFPDLSRFGAVSPHAPYTASAGLYRAAKKLAQDRGLMFTTHVNESEEEMEMFTLASGPLYDLMSGLGRDMSDCGQTSALSVLLEEALLPPGSVLAHVNFCDQGEMARLREEGHSVVHCPSCHEFFQREKFSVRDFLRAGVNVALGSDSAATGATLSMIEEMRIFRKAQPDMTMAEIFTLATRGGAKALRLESRLGVVAEGYLASFFAISHKGRPPLHALFEHRGAVTWACCEGRVIHAV